MRAAIKRTPEMDDDVKKWGVWSLSIPSPGWVYERNMEILTFGTQEDAEEYARQCREFYVPNKYEARLICCAVSRPS